MPATPFPPVPLHQTQREHLSLAASLLLPNYDGALPINVARRKSKQWFKGDRRRVHEIVAFNTYRM
jgi:hypothetical protein